MNKLTLGNKSILSWNEYGSTDGEPVFYFHGIPGSRLEVKPADSIAQDFGIRLIATDRPGYGDSDLQESFKPLDWPGIITQLADSLSIHKFSILSYSGGGLYALACAHVIPDRVNKITLISSSAPYNFDVMQSSVHANFKPLYDLVAADYESALEQISQMAASPETLLSIYEASLPSEDINVLSDKNIRTQILENLTLATSKGVEGFTSDLRSFSLPWQFKLEDIRTKIEVWHGHKDQIIGFPVAEYLASSLESTSTRFHENGGHLFLFDHWHEVLASIKNKTT